MKQFTTKSTKLKAFINIDFFVMNFNNGSIAE